MALEYYTYTLTYPLGGAQGFATMPAGGYRNVPDAPAPAPVAPAPAPSIAPVLDNNVSVSVYGRVIPISAGKRRLPGDLIWLRQDQLNTEGQYTANGAYSFGYRLIPASTCNLVKLWANGVIIYDAVAGFQAEGLTFVFYDGSQTAIDPEIAADKGAAITPAYKEQIYIRGIFPTKEFNGSLPNISALVADGPGGNRTFLPWATFGTPETLNPDDKSEEINLTNGNTTAERVDPAPVGPAGAAWAAVRGTRGREANQPDGQGWFVFEAQNDFIPDIPVLFNMEYQGPGLATAAYGLDGEDARNSPACLYASALGNTFGNSSSTGALPPAGGPTMDVGDRPVMFAVRLDIMKMWKGITDGGSSDWHNPASFPGHGDPMEGTGGLDISFLAGQGQIFPAWFSTVRAQKGTLNQTGGFANLPPGATGTGGITSVSTLIDCIIAVGARCGFSIDDFRFVGLDDIGVTGIVITSDTDFLAYLKNSARVYGFDYTESGGQILCRKAVIGSSYTVDLGGIPEAALIPTSKEAAVTTTRDSSHRADIIELSYQDQTIDYQPSVQRARIPRVKSPMNDSFAIPYVMSAQEAITGAATALYREFAQRISHVFQLPFQYEALEPTDLIQFTSSGKDYTVKVSNVVRNSDLSVKVTGINLLTAEAEPISGEFTGENFEDYHGAGYSGDANIGRLPLEIPPPIVITSSATFSVVEDTTAVATLTATGGAPPYTWTKIGGTDSAKFNLSSGGVLTFATAPDFGAPSDADANNIYLLDVQAATAGPLSATQSIAVTVTEFPALAITSPANFLTPENQTAISTLHATGGNGGPYTWTKIGGADIAKFTLSSGGVLTFATAPDYETPTDADANNVYLVQVRASDGTRTASQSIAVTVQDASELPPISVTSSATFSVAENSTAIGTLTATGGTGGPYTWAKTGGADAGAFTLTSGGVLSFATAPDFEAPTDADANNVYVVAVTATDGLTSSPPQTISVTVTNISELFAKMDFSRADNSGYTIFLDEDI